MLMQTLQCRRASSFRPLPRIDGANKALIWSTTAPGGVSVPDRGADILAQVVEFPIRIRRF